MTYRSPESVAKRRVESREWKAANRERVREYNAVYYKAWRAANEEKERTRQRGRSAKRRAINRGAAGATYTTRTHIEARVALYGGRCFYCGAEYESIDHRIPLARGGSHWPANLVPACVQCNSRKGTKTEREFRER